MMNVRVLNSYIFKENAAWNVRCGALSASFSFDEKQGVVMHDFINASEGNPVSYFEKRQSILPIACEGEAFRLVAEKAEKIIFAGKEILQAKITVESNNFYITFYVDAYPDSSVLRYYFDVIAKTDGQKSLLKPLSYEICMDNPKHLYTCSYFHGGLAAYQHGEREDFPIGTGWQPPKVELHSDKTSEYVPLVFIRRNEAPRDGFMVQMDYIATWDFRLQRNAMRQRPELFSFDFELDNRTEYEFKKDKTLRTPTITLAVYRGDHDNLMEILYDWQYSYMWDYVNVDYFAKTRSASRWVACTRNLHEQFAYRLSAIAMDSLRMSRLGFDILWDDAGWSACDEWPVAGYGSVFFNNYEGPDFSSYRRFLTKCNKRWLVWFAGKPSAEIMENKTAAWGEFEWRTDAVYLNGIDEEHKFKDTIVQYLDGAPTRSFHTCSGGSTYAHSFDIVRYSNYNYLADAGRGPAATYNFSYFEYPDKWGDILPFMGPLAFTDDYGTICPDEDVVQDVQNVRYMPKFARAGLVSVPFPGESFCAEDEAYVRTDLTLYRYFLEKGIAGRFSYCYHPEVFGDREIYYMQRTSADKLRACIVIKRPPCVRTIVYPKGLLDDELYSVRFMCNGQQAVRSGADLKENGILLKDVADGELIFLNLDDHPVAQTESAATSEGALAPFTVRKREENNVGVHGVALYWAEVVEADRYDVYKNGEFLYGQNKSVYTFDYTGNIEDEYTVYAIQNNVRIAKGIAAILSGSVRVYSTLGDYGKRAEGSPWGAEYSYDGEKFMPMQFVAPEKTPFADYGGLPHQEGGIMGYYEGGKCAKVGHAFMQASSDVYTARTFTCPYDGKISLSVRTMKEWYHLEEGCDLEFSVRMNGKPLTPWLPVEKGNVYGASFHEILQVNKGDKLSFVLGKAEVENEQPIFWEHDASLVGSIPVIAYLSDEEEEGYYKRASNLQAEEKSFTVEEGVYKLCLKLSAEGKLIDENRVNIYINGRLIEKDVDVVQSTRGGGLLVKNFRYLLPIDGRISVRIENVQGHTMVESIELGKESERMYRINCGGEEFIDWSGTVWEKDTQCGKESISLQSGKVSGATPTIFDRDLYFTAVESEKIRYEFALKNGLYFVRLKFMEDGGEHAFDVRINGEQKYTFADLEKNGGGNRVAVDRYFDNIPVSDGKLVIELSGREDKKAIIQAIEIGV